MAIIRTKNNVPQVYVSESRDFQLFTRVLDFTQNALKYDIDSMLNVLSTEDISEEHLYYLQSKIGFFTNRAYDESTMRKVLAAMPYIMKYKGSEAGIEMCINTFLNIVGFRDGYLVSIYNENDDANLRYKIRIGIDGNEVNTDILKDMLSYIIPTGYFVEFYFYKDVASINTKSILHTSKTRILDDGKRVSVVSEAIEANWDDSKIDETMEDDTYGTVQLSTVVKESLLEEEIDDNE